MRLKQLIDLLLEKEGITKVEVETKVTATIELQDTGDVSLVDEDLQAVRERVVSEDELASLVDDTAWWYMGTVDVVGDYHLRDRFRKHHAIESNGHDQ